MVFCQTFLQTASKVTQVKSYIRTKTTTNCPKWKEHKHLRLKSITLFSLNRNSFFTSSLCILFFYYYHCIFNLFNVSMYNIRWEHTVCRIGSVTVTMCIEYISMSSRTRFAYRFVQTSSSEFYFFFSFHLKHVRRATICFDVLTRQENSLSNTKTVS